VLAGADLSAAYAALVSSDAAIIAVAKIGFIVRPLVSNVAKTAISGGEGDKTYH
jgi:hypothetical protein